MLKGCAILCLNFTALSFGGFLFMRTAGGYEKEVRHTKPLLVFDAGVALALWILLFLS